MKWVIIKGVRYPISVVSAFAAYYGDNPFLKIRIRNKYHIIYFDNMDYLNIQIRYLINNYPDFVQIGMWLREAGKEQMVYAFFEDGTGYEKTTDRRNNTVSVDGFTYEFDPNTMSIVFDKEFDNAIYSEWTVEMKGKSYMILTHHGIWDAGHGLTHEDTYSFELFRIMDE